MKKVEAIISDHQKCGEFTRVSTAILANEASYGTVGTRNAKALYYFWQHWGIYEKRVANLALKPWNMCPICIMDNEIFCVFSVDFFRIFNIHATFSRPNYWLEFFYSMPILGQ